MEKLKCDFCGAKYDDYQCSKHKKKTEGCLTCHGEIFHSPCMCCFYKRETSTEAKRIEEACRTCIRKTGNFSIISIENIKEEDGRDEEKKQEKHLFANQEMENKSHERYFPKP